MAEKNFTTVRPTPKRPVAMKRVEKRLKHHLSFRDLVTALSLSDGNQKVEQADAKSSVKAKNEQAA